MPTNLRRLLRHRGALLGMLITGTIVIAALFAPYLAPYPYAAQHLDAIRAAPGERFLLGTDSLGRDVLSRLLYGARIALTIALAVVVVELVIGVTLGMLAGYFGGWLDVAIGIITDIVWAFPPLVLALAVVAAMGAGLLQAVMAIALVSWVPFARVTRAKVMSLREREYVVASAALGGGSLHIMRKHILPNMLATLLVMVTLILPGALLTAAALSFLGFGVQPPTPEWGAMLSEGRNYMQDAPWISTFPGLAILLTTVGFNLLSDALRDVFDPR
jgi:peptide/nickel transport system permease protein